MTPNDLVSQTVSTEHVSDTGSEPEHRSFRMAVLAESRLIDLLLIVSVPIVLVTLFFLPTGTKEQLVFQRAEPSVVTAYTAHFVHRQQFHLIGNLWVYLVVVPVIYLLCVLSARRQLFRVSFVTLLTVFPFALSGLQLVFPRERDILGFSGINAGFFGVLCLAWLVYVGTHFLEKRGLRYAPVVLLVTTGIIALVSLPARAWRVEIAAFAFLTGLAYLAADLRSTGLPSLGTIREGFEKPGYSELAGAGLGLLLSYPFVGFRELVTVERGVIDVYVHLLGYALAIIVVYLYLVVTGTD